MRLPGLRAGLCWWRLTGLTVPGLGPSMLLAAWFPLLCKPRRLRAWRSSTSAVVASTAMAVNASSLCAHGCSRALRPPQMQGLPTHTVHPGMIASPKHLLPSLKRTLTVNIVLVLR